MKICLVCLLPVILLFFCYDCQDLQIDPLTTAYVTIGKPLTLTCIYTGNNTPIIVRWFLNNDTTGMLISKTTCMIIGTPGTAYEVSRYAINCSQLTITDITENDIDDQWGCTVVFSAATSPLVSSTKIKKALPTTTPSPNALCTPDGALFIILDICIIISCIIVVILIIDLIIWKKKLTISIFMACVKTGHRCLCILYIVLVIIVAICGISIIIMIIIGRQCQNILIVGLVLGLIIMIVTIIFVIVFIKTGVMISNKGKMQNPRTNTDVKITATLRQIFISEIEWIGPKGNTLSTEGKYIVAQYNSDTGESSLTITNVSQDDNGQYICQSKNGFKIAKDSIHIMCADTEKRTKNAVCSSALSRKDVELQMAKKDGMSDEEERPPAIHIGTQNKTEPKTTSKQVNERPQPLPPVGGVAEDKLKPRPQPPRPENIDAKDRNLRGLSANYDDAQGLASGTPQSNKLPPLTLKQETVQEEDASEEKMKKKRKKKKKKGQMNEENQAEEMEELKSQRTSSED